MKRSICLPWNAGTLSVIDGKFTASTWDGIWDYRRTTRFDPSVDWDLWQAVVSEGPAAVKRSSSEELTYAIAAGIPQAIEASFGRFWQTAKTREWSGYTRIWLLEGTEKDKSVNGNSGLEANGNGKDKESVASSASSVHSEKAGASSFAESGDGFTNPQAPKAQVCEGGACSHPRSLRRRFDGTWEPELAIPNI